MNIGDLYAQSLRIASDGADLILVSPEKYTGFTEIKEGNSRNTRGFVFQIIGDEVLNLQSDITDHYVEDNISKQDHISLKPRKITVSGYIGELNNVIPPLLEPAKEKLDRLGVLSSYIPLVTIAAQRAFDMAQQAYSLGTKIGNAASIKMGVDVKTKQQQAYGELEDLWKNRALFWVATPYGQFQNMAIESINVSQSSDTKYISDFSVTFKEMRFTTTQIIVSSERIQNVDESQYSGHMAVS